MISSIKDRIGRQPLLLGSILLSLWLVGCGSDDPTTPTNPFINPEGTGSGTLQVIADLEGSDAGGGIFVTNYTVRVTDSSSSPVSGATVAIAGPSGSISLAEDLSELGTYRFSTGSYSPGTYVLSVTSGNDFINNVRVVAPDVHTITTPTANETVSADQILMIGWTRASAADELRIESRDYESPSSELDDGVSAVPAIGNPPRLDQRIRIYRTNTRTIAGGLPTSRFEAEIRNSVEPIISM